MGFTEYCVAICQGTLDWTVTSRSRLAKEEGVNCITTIKSSSSGGGGEDGLN